MSEEMIKELISFSLFSGCFYITFEVFFNAIYNMSQVNINKLDSNNDNKQDGKILRFGYTSIWMFIPAFSLGFLIRLLWHIPIMQKFFMIPIWCIITGASITGIELLLGSIFVKFFKLRLWDYSKKKYNYHGHICILHSTGWFFLGILTFLIMKFTI